MSWSQTHYRIRQGLAALRSAPPLDRDAILASTLTQPQAEAFRSLSPFDQAHLCRVYRSIKDAGATDPDLLTAALLHDIGKAGPYGQARVPDRVVRVILGRLAPTMLARLSHLPAPRWRAGIALAVHHPQLGADQAKALGCSARTCWLIAHHEDIPPPPDPDLARLITADR